MDPAANPENYTPQVITVLIMAALIFFTGIIIDIRLLLRARCRHLDWIKIRERLIARPWHWNDGSALFLSLLGVILCMSILARILPDHITETNIFILCQLIVLHIVGLAALTAITRSKGIRIAGAFGINTSNISRDVKHGIISYFALIPPLALTSFIYLRFLEFTNIEVTLQPQLEYLTNPMYPWWIHATLAVMAVLVAPAIEEMIFRGVLLPVMLRNARTSLAVTLVSVLFAVIHTHLPAVVPIFVLAVALSLGYLISGSLLVPVITHTIFNGVSLAAYILTRNSPLFD